MSRRDPHPAGESSGTRRVRFSVPDSSTISEQDEDGATSQAGSFLTEPYESDISYDSRVLEHDTIYEEPDSELDAFRLLDARESHLNAEGLEYGEEPISIVDEVEEGQVQELFNRQTLPESAARYQKRPMDMSIGELGQYAKQLDHVHDPSRIREGLYVANYETACHYFSGEGNRTKYFPKIGYILSIILFSPGNEQMYDALKPVDSKEFPEGTTLMLRVKDSTQVNFMELFPLIINFIVRALKEGGSDKGHGRGVLVHCRKGMSRSITAVMAYLVWADNESVINIWRQVKMARMVAWPNSEFYTQLVMWKMWDCKLTDEKGEPLPQYREYVVEKGLRSACEGVKADLTMHLNPIKLEPPPRWPLKYLWEIE